MTDSQTATSLADSIRFAGDIQSTPLYLQDVAHFQQFSSAFRHSDLLVCDSLTPVLANAIDEVVIRLRMPRKAVEAYIFESPNVQAHCLTGYSGACVIRFSSGLVTLLSPAEFKFVVGHELGHFLLRHTTPSDETRESPERQIIRRAAEISADRIGLVACGDLEIAMRALMKSVSGLQDKYLRFDVASYVAQLGESEITSQSSSLTHPSIPVRCRALLWFSLMPEAIQGQLKPAHREALDLRITRDLNKFIDAAANEQIRIAEKSLAMWLSIKSIVEDGRYSKSEQAWFIERFGNEASSSVTNIFSAISHRDAIELADGRSEDALNELKSLAPHTWGERLKIAQIMAASLPASDRQ